MHQPPLLISACLLGDKVKYDGGDNRLSIADLKQLSTVATLFPVCPEVSGGLGTPRIPAEMRDGRVMNAQGEEVTAAFESGAEAALDVVKEHGIKAALLKERSPSCGVHEIYDGSFSKSKIVGKGVAALALERAGVRLFNENEIPECIEYLQQIKE